MYAFYTKNNGVEHISTENHCFLYRKHTFIAKTAIAHMIFLIFKVFPVFFCFLKLSPWVTTLLGKPAGHKGK